VIQNVLGRVSLILLFGMSAGMRALVAQTPATDSARIHQLGGQFSSAFMRGDAAAMAALYTPDGVVFPERSAWITGREAIARYFAPAPRSRITTHRLNPHRIVVDGEHAYDYGTYEIAGERDGKAWGPSRGKYVVVWRRHQDTWRMQLDIWNSVEEGAP
jgi:uncharacterized protein (TIGR02246 family)